MNNLYEPKQDLCYVFSRRKKILFIKSIISVPVNPNDDLEIENTPLMTTEATIKLKASTQNKETPSVCKKEILIPYLSGFESNSTEDHIRAKIKEDLKSKNITNLKVNLDVNKTTGEVGGQTTSTISGNAEIIID